MLKSTIFFYGIIGLFYNMGNVHKPSGLNNNPVIAHRGAWKIQKLPENSIASLREAGRLKCFGSEFDVHLTADSIMVVNHDPDFMGMHIATSTYAQLCTKKLPNGELIPTLEAYLKEGKKQKGMRLVLEVKPQKLGAERDMYLTARCMELVKTLRCRNQVSYISFGYDICKYIVQQDSKAEVQYLGGDVAPDKIKADGISGLDYHFSVFKKNPDWIKEAQNASLVTNAWTVNEKADMEWLLDKGIGFITTNEPEQLLDLLKTRK